MSRVHMFWCVRCGYDTTNILDANSHETKHPEIRKIGML